MDRHCWILQPWPAARTAACLLMAAFVAAPILQAQPNPDSQRLPLREVTQRVLDYNQSIQMKLIESEISQKTHQAERGIFEPQVVGSVERVDSQRPNNTLQRLSLGFSPTTQLNERNLLYNGGLEFLIPSGARLKTGYTLRELENNLQRTIGQEFETFVGASLVQPLLKNFGPAATMVRIRLAALASDIAFQEYRRQLMLVLSQAEAAYWDLYLGQEQERITQESVAMASKILEDNQARNQVGKSSALEVLQAEAGLSLRRSRRKVAQLKVSEEANRLGSFYSDTSLQTNQTARVLDPPDIQGVVLDYFDNYQMAYAYNPDFLIRLKQVDQENIRVQFARNQRLPQLDLKASYGLNGLGSSPGDSGDQVADAEFPAWSLGVELRIPVTGGIKEKREWEAAKLAKSRALFSLKETEVQIANSLESAIQRVRTYQDNVPSYQSVIKFHEQLLEAQLARLEVGSIDSKTVLETEEKLFEAKVNAVENLVLYRKALLELELIRGSTLSSRQLELTQDELQEKTADMLRSGQWSAERLESMQNEALQQLEPEEPARDEAVQALRRKLQELNGAPSPSATRWHTLPSEPSNAEEEATRRMREQLRQLRRD